METMIIQRRTIELPKGKSPIVKVKYKKLRHPRKLKKALKKKHGYYSVLMTYGFFMQSKEEFKKAWDDQLLYGQSKIHVSENGIKRIHPFE